MTDNERRKRVSGSGSDSPNNTGSKTVTLSQTTDPKNDPETIYNVLFKDYDEEKDE